MRWNVELSIAGRFDRPWHLATMGGLAWDAYENGELRPEADRIFFGDDLDDARQRVILPDGREKLPIRRPETLMMPPPYRARFLLDPFYILIAWIGLGPAEQAIIAAAYPTAALALKLAACTVEAGPCDLRAKQILTKGAAGEPLNEEEEVFCSAWFKHHMPNEYGVIRAAGQSAYEYMLRRIGKAMRKNRLAGSCFVVGATDPFGMQEPAQQPRSFVLHQALMTLLCRRACLLWGEWPGSGTTPIGGQVSVGLNLTQELLDVIGHGELQSARDTAVQRCGSVGVRVQPGAVGMLSPALYAPRRRPQALLADFIACHLRNTAMNNLGASSYEALSRSFCSLMGLPPDILKGPAVATQAYAPATLLHATNLLRGKNVDPPLPRAPTVAAVHPAEQEVSVALAEALQGIPGYLLHLHRVPPISPWWVRDQIEAWIEVARNV